MAEISLSATEAALEYQPRAARGVASVALDARFGGYDDEYTDTNRYNGTTRATGPS